MTLSPINSLPPGEYGSNFKSVIFEYVLQMVNAT